MSQFAYDKPKTIARLAILHHIAEFSLSREIGGQPYGGLKDMRFRENHRPEPGTLVALSSAGRSKWYLSWVVSSDTPDGWAGPEYVLESIEDGEIGSWTNVGIWQYDPATTASHPEWRWTDRQHELNSRWFRVCYKKRDAYIRLPVQLSFDGDAVLFRVRTRFGLDSHVPARTFPNWRKVTIAMMLDFYDSAVAEIEAQKSPARDEQPK